MKLFLFLFLLLPSCAAAQVFSNDSVRAFPLGEIRSLHSAALGEDRVLNIYLPEGYAADDSSRYPVVYLLDGSADEDFIHVAGLIQFNTFPWVASMPKSILVGIANVDRKRDFTFASTLAGDRQLLPTGGHSDSFIAFVEKELQPYISSHYRCDTGNRMLIGQSLGGLLAAEVLLKKPQLFNRYALISPSIWWAGGAMLKLPLRLPAGKGPVAVYIAVGKEGLTPSKPPRVMEEDARLLAGKLRREGGTRIKVHFDYLPAENHASIGHVAVMHAFDWLYSGARNASKK